MGFLFLIFSFIFLILFLALVYSWMKYKILQTKFSHFPALVSQFLDSFDVPVFFNWIPYSWAPHRRAYGYTHGKTLQFYKQLKTDIYALVTRKKGYLYIADADVFKQIFVDNAKDYHREPTPGFQLFGGSDLLNSDGDEWRRHSRVVRPAFNEKTYRLVHEASVRLVQLMFKHWESKSQVTEEKHRETTVELRPEILQLTLGVLSHSAFGKPVEWRDSQEKISVFHLENNSTTGTHKYTFQKALEIFIEYIFYFVMLPKWAFKLPIKKLQALKGVKEDLTVHLKEMVVEKEKLLDQERKEGSTEETVDVVSRQNDLFTNLLASSRSAENVNAKATLSENELYQELFLFIGAGHENTAGTLIIALTLLAVHPEIQEKFYMEVSKKLGGGRVPEFEDLVSLRYSQYIIKETLRLYPLVFGYRKTVLKTTRLEIPKSYFGKKTVSSGGEEASTVRDATSSVVVSKGTGIYFDVTALQRNPKYWNRPDEFLPDRFDPHSTIQQNVVLDKSATEGGEASSDSKLTYHRFAWAPFNEGQRMCIGRKFSETEMTTVLSMIIQNYSIHLSPKMNKEKVLDTEVVFTLRLAIPVELIFRKRE